MTQDELANTIRLMIKSKFDLDIPVYIILRDELAELLQHAPDWWGSDDKEIYHNLIFILPPAVSVINLPFGQPIQRAK